jgi:hypothetical protein
MQWFRAMRIVFALAAFALLAAHSFAQTDDPNDTPLGDVARNLRKKNPPVQPVIDDDNLSTVMKQAESHKSANSAWKFLTGMGEKSIQVTGPDVNCSLSYTANAKSLLSRQYAQMDLPADDMVRLEGPATIDGNTLAVAVFNGTNWHVSEVDVALTVIKKANQSSSPFDFAGFAPAANAETAPSQESDFRSQKNADATVIYHMRAAAAPSATTIFNAPLAEEVEPGEEWHWSIVEAKGYPPENYLATAMPTVTQTSSAIAVGQSQPVASLPQGPQ